MEIVNWGTYEKLEFKNESFDLIDLLTCTPSPNQYGFDFNTELIFTDCVIKSFVAPTLLLGKKIKFDNCTIDQFWCHATYFHGGLELKNCLIKHESHFDCGGHNISPNEVIIDKCQFNEFVNFFDIYYEGPVSITNNRFEKGTNIVTYLDVPFGIKEGIPFKIERNEGQLDVLEND